MTELTTDDIERSLARAAYISLFSWRRAESSDPVDDDERYGWWGDSFPSVANDRIGSRLWLLRRSKLTDRTIGDAQLYAREALQWLLDDGHISDLEILAERAGNDRLNLGVVMTLPGGGRLVIYPNEEWQVIYAL